MEAEAVKTVSAFLIEHFLPIPLCTNLKKCDTLYIMGAKVLARVRHTRKREKWGKKQHERFNKIKCVYAD